MKYALISTSRIITPKNHDKTRCGNGEIVRLAKSIQKLGLLEPITVKPLIGGDGYEIISGNKRFCALSMLGEKKIPCILTESTQNNSLIYITLQKYSKHNPFVLADKLKRMLTSGDKSAEETADALGMEITEFIEYLLPSRMTQIERQIAIENRLSEENIRKIATEPELKKRLDALSVYISGKTPSGLSMAKKAKARRNVPRGELKLFENTVKRAISLLEGLGYSAKNETSEFGNNIEYKIKLSKSVAN